MEDFETTRKQVFDLRIQELKDVLEYAELNADGPKKTLQDRLIEAARADIYKFKPYISQISSLRFKIKSRKFHHPEPHNSKRSRSLLRMDAMPLYDFHSDTITTTALISSFRENSSEEILEVSPEFSTRFDLWDSQKELIFGPSGRALMPSTKARIFLRIGLDLDQLLIEDNFPAGINIMVNGRHVPLPDVLPSKPNHLTRRFPKPVDITDHLVGGNSRNSISISWSGSETRKFLFTVFCAVKQDTNELLRRLHSKKRIDESATIELIRKFYQPTEEFSSVSECVVSLCCPLLKTRLKNPSRGRSCNHVQCFDAETYIQINEKRPKWECPICGARAYFCDIRIDRFFEKILSSNLLSPSANNITIDKLGNWEEKKDVVLATSAGNKRPQTSDLEIISLSSDEEDEEPPPRKIRQRSYNAVPYGPYTERHTSHSISSVESSNLDREIITIDD